MGQIAKLLCLGWCLCLLPLAALAADAPAAKFSRDVYPVLQKADCRSCHNAEGVGSTTRLLFPELASTEEEVEIFGDSLRKLVNAANPDKSLLLLKPTNRMAHAGGRRIVPDSPDEAAIAVWVRHLATTKPMAISESAAKTEAGARRPVLRRLTHSQYDNTVRDLLGDISRPSRQFPPEDFVDGFQNQYAAQSISPLLAEAYGEAAERLATRAKLPPYKDFVAEFGRRAFRRPLSPGEKARYGTLLAKGGPKAVLEAMLQSPSFLYRPESTVGAAQPGYIRASKLSYLLWDTMPDEPLLNAAAQGELDTPAGVERWARKMLRDPRAHEALDQFISQWMRFDRIITMVKERRAYPLFTRELALAMTEETRRFFGDLVWSDRSFLDFFTANATFVNGDLAAIYGMKAPGDDFAKVEYPPESGRAGILSQATFLALTSKPAETAPTSRGLFIREQFLCQNVPQPPPGVNTNLPPQSEERPLTTRERLVAHLSNPSCATCHNLIDPIGLGFEKFDGIGAYRQGMRVSIPSYDRKKEAKTVELPIDSKGWVAGIPGSEFERPRELGAILAATPQCQECIVKQYLRYARGLHEGLADKALIARITEDFRNSGYRFQELVVSVVKWWEFPPGS